MSHFLRHVPLRVFVTIIDAAAKSKKLNKEKIAVNILRQMQSVALRPVKISYNSVLNACALSNGDEGNKTEILQIALAMLREARETCGACYVTCNTCLRIIASLQPDKGERWKLAKDIFGQYCSDKQVTPLILAQLKYTVAPARSSLLLREVIDEQTGKIREDVTLNAKRAKMTPLKTFRYKI